MLGRISCQGRPSQSGRIGPKAWLCLAWGQHERCPRAGFEAQAQNPPPMTGGRGSLDPGYGNSAADASHVETRRSDGICGNFNADANDDNLEFIEPSASLGLRTLHRWSCTRDETHGCTLVEDAALSNAGIDIRYSGLRILHRRVAQRGDTRMHSGRRQGVVQRWQRHSLSGRRCLHR